VRRLGLTVGSLLQVVDIAAEQPRASAGRGAERGIAGDGADNSAAGRAGWRRR
jgi:hypothetical protein